VPFFNSSEANKSSTELPVGRVWTSLCDYKFERVVCDEAHTLRNPQTLVSEGLRQTQTQNKNFLTTTPIVNHCRELGGILTQIWNPLWALHQVGIGFLECYGDRFDPRSVTITENKKSKVVNLVPPDKTKTHEAYLAYQEALQNNDKIWLLDPDNYRSYGSGFQWSPYVTAIIIPPILKMVMLRMTTASHLDLGDGQGLRRVGEEVPPCHVYAIELRMERDESRQYNDSIYHLFKQLFVGDTTKMPPKPQTTKPSVAEPNSENPEGIQDAGVHRFIMHCTMDPRLASLTLRNHKNMTAAQKKAASKSKRNNWIDVDFDHGASFYFAKTRAGPEYSIPADRLSLATYMCAKSVKIRYILYLMSEWVIKLHEKVILVFEYPMSQW
jgi:SNF2-related domain